MNDINTASRRIDELKPYHCVVGHVSTNINFNMHIHENGIGVNCTYKTGVIDQSEIAGVCDHFVNVMRHAVNSPDMPMEDWDQSV